MQPEYYVEDLYTAHGLDWKLKLAFGPKWLSREIFHPEAQRPGLALSGFLEEFDSTRLLVWGKGEVLYLEQLKRDIAHTRLEDVITEETPAVFVADSENIPKPLATVCKVREIPLFESSLPAIELLNGISTQLLEDFAPMISRHGTFIEAFDAGILIQGDSSIGKSESALGLLDRGHRLISDDLVKLKKKKDGTIEGCGSELNKHMMEIRGIGLINVAHLHGAVCVRSKKSLDLIVQLEEWSDDAFYDRVGLDEKFVELLGVQIPYYILPVKPGRDVVLLIETIVLNHRLKMMGYHSAREFNRKLLESIARNRKKDVSVSKRSQKRNAAAKVE